jgi:hypothetical protein
MTVDPIERTNFTLSAGVLVASLALASPAFAASVAVGALLEAWSFRTLRRSAQFLFWGQIQGGRGWLGVYSLRTTLLLLGIASALYFGAHPIGLVIGLSIVIPATLIETWRTRPTVDPTAPSLAPDDPAWDRWNPWLARERHADEDGEDA